MTAVLPSGEGLAADRPAPTRKPRLNRGILAVGLALAASAAGAIYLTSPKSSVSTDAAYIQADSSSVAPKVGGLIAEVLVGHNQAVRRGDPLIRIDPEEFDSRAASAAAGLLNAQASVQAAAAALVALDAEERLAASGVRAAQTTIQAADAQRDRAFADRTRFDNLVASGAVARRDAEQYRAAAITAQSVADRSRAELDVSRSQASVVGAKRAALQAELAEAQAKVAGAQAVLDLARQDQAHTVVRAPIDGVVGDLQARPGDYVQPGGRLLTLVPMRSLYVTANFKETQVSRMVAGQSATIRVDAMPGRTFRGRVDSFAPGSGSHFSLLPFEPGTGNFTKIVQRVPVRIGLEPGQGGLERLRPGLSTTVKVSLDPG